MQINIKKIKRNRRNAAKRITFKDMLCTWKYPLKVLDTQSNASIKAMSLKHNRVAKENWNR